MGSNVVNKEAQRDEIEALAAIYGDDWSVVDHENRVFNIVIKGSSYDKYIVNLSVTLTPSYPSDSPPIYEINAPWLKGNQRNELMSNLEEIYLQNIGENILFLWAEKVKEFLELNVSDDEVTNLQDLSKSEDNVEVVENVTYKNTNSLNQEIFHGETITDRKSVFQGHMSAVSSVREVECVLSCLKRNKKIANATHNILAYRIYDDKKKIFLQDSDDDGEHAAGGRLLHLLQILDVKDVVVVVTRWYGGIHLGPDRFKHINNAARSILAENGFCSTKSSKQKKR